MPDTHKKTTLADIAAKAGVTVATVSMALRDHPRISAKRRRQVQSIARSMDYRPDAKLSELMAYLRKKERPEYAGTLAVLIGSQHNQQWETIRPFTDIIRGIRDQASELGYGLDIIWSADPDLRPERLEAILAERGIQGLILLQKRPDPWPENSFDWSRFCPVRILDAIDEPGIPMVRGNHIEHARIAAEHIARAGYNRAVLVVGENNPEVMNTGWRMGFETVLRDKGIGHLSLITPHGRKASIEETLRAFNPEVVVSISEAKNRILPLCPDMKETSFISLNISVDDKKTSGIVMPHDLVGRQCVNVAVGQINRNQPGLRDHEMHTIITGTWQDGETFRPRKQGVG